MIVQSSQLEKMSELLLLKDQVKEQLETLEVVATNPQSVEALIAISSEVRRVSKLSRSLAREITELSHNQRSGMRH